MIQISKKGRDYFGHKLKEYDFVDTRLVVWKKHIYLSGKFFYDRIILCDAEGNELYHVQVKDVKLIVL